MTAKTGVIPPPEVAREAQKGLELREKFHRGGTSVGLRHARQLAERHPVSIRDIAAISEFFARHAADGTADLREEDNPSAAHIAWLMWGGDPGREWANRMKAKVERIR